MTYLFGISEFTTWPWSFERDLESYPANGAATIEICEFKLDRDDYAPQLRKIAAGGMTVSSVQSTVHSLFPDSLAPQPTAFEDRMRHMEEAMKRISPFLPPQTPFVVITGVAPGGNCAMVYDTALRAFDRLASTAHKHGMRLAFEPLNPVLFNTDTALWGLDNALELIGRIGNDALGLCVDTWNVFQTPDLHDVIRACKDRVFVVQVSDWRRPRSGADRVSLGDGCIDTPAIVKTLRETGYGGPYVLEIFSGESLPGSLWCGDMDSVLQKNAEAFSVAWKASLQ